MFESLNAWVIKWLFQKKVKRKNRDFVKKKIKKNANVAELTGIQMKKIWPKLIKTEDDSKNPVFVFLMHWKSLRAGVLMYICIINNFCISILLKS